MKKTYITPFVEVDGMESEDFICVSQSITSGGNVTGITYGGVDDQGTKDPSSRRLDVWGDDEE